MKAKNGGVGMSDDQVEKYVFYHHSWSLDNSQHVVIGL